MDHKKRIQAAIGRFLDKNQPHVARKKHNGKPEKEVEKEVLVWCRARGWAVNVVESKSTWSEKQRRYISQSVIPGMSDLVGNTDEGLSVYIELKAPGHRSSLRMSQYLFLMKKIETGCFAVCTDGVNHLSEVWETYLKAERKKDYLKAILKMPKTKDRDLTFDE